MLKSKEKILVFGKGGASKSHQFLNIVMHMLALNEMLGTDYRAYVCDSDADNYYRMIETQARFKILEAEIGNHLHVFPVWTYPQWAASLETIMKSLREGDWVGIDRADMLWEATQDYYVEQVHGMKAGDYFLMKRRELEKARPDAKQLVVLEGDKDWQVINRMYRQLWGPLVAPGSIHNLYAAVASSDLEKRDEAEIKEKYQRFGQRPSGQKHLPYQVHTELYFRSPSPHSGKFFVSTAKDRTGVQNYFDNENLWDLSMQYLVGKVGWPMPLGNTKGWPFQP